MYRHPFMSYGSVVSTEHYLSSLMAVEVLKEGGNAVDAAVVASLSLSVLLPHLGGLGGDFFALVMMKGEIRFIDGSGPSPLSLRRNELIRKGCREMPQRGPLSITVPGMVDALYLMWKNFGKINWSDLVLKVRDLAKNGFPVSRSLAKAVRSNESLLSMDPGSSYYLGLREQGIRAVFDGLAKALEVISRDPREFYEGDISYKISSYVKERGGFLSEEDLESYHAGVRDPLKVKVWGCSAYEMPPPTQGATTLHMMMLTEGKEPKLPNSWDRIVEMVEAAKIAYSVRDRYITDPAYMRIGEKELLDPSILEIPASRLKRSSDGDTTSFSIVDLEGNVVAGIQSLFTAFGSGITEPTYQISLNSRGSSFSLAEDHVNRLESGKRTLHTLSSLLIDCDGEKYAIGTSGGHFRPQLHWWLAGNLLTYRMDPQESIEYPRVYADLARDTLIAEEGLESERASLALGLKLMKMSYPSRMGVASLAHLRKDGLRIGCSDIRGDGDSYGTI